MAKTFLRYGVSLLLLQLALGCTSQSANQNAAPEAQNAATPVTVSTPTADAKLVVAFGDSLYAGYNLDADKGFAPALQRALNAKGVKASVFNAGVSGDTTAAGLQRLAFTLDGLPKKPDLVIVGLGGNDMLRGLSPAETRKNLDAILAELKRRGIAIAMTGILASPNMGPDYAAAFNPIYADLAKRYDATLYPFFLEGVIGTPALMLPDGIHPNGKGVDIIASRVVPMIAAQLAE